MLFFILDTNPHQLLRILKRTLIEIRPSKRLSWLQGQSQDRIKMDFYQSQKFTLDTVESQYEMIALTFTVSTMSSKIKPSSVLIRKNRLDESGIQNQAQHYSKMNFNCDCAPMPFSLAPSLRC